MITKDLIEYVFERACLRKKNLTFIQAEQVVDERFRKGSLVYYYKCEFCSSYHITSKEPFTRDHIIKVA
jgi:hypothetical protein